MKQLTIWALVILFTVAFGIGATYVTDRYISANLFTVTNGTSTYDINLNNSGVYLSGSKLTKAYDVVVCSYDGTNPEVYQECDVVCTYTDDCGILINSAHQVGNHVYIRAGYYNISTSIAQKANTIFEGDGIATHFVLNVSTNNLWNITNDDSTLSNIFLDGNRVGTSTTAYRVLHINSVHNTRVNNVYVYNGYSRGIEVDYCKDCFFNNLYLNNSWRNLMIWISPASVNSSQKYNTDFQNVYHYNSVENGIDVTYRDLKMTHIRGDDKIYIDGFDNVIIKDTDRGINVGAGNWNGSYGGSIQILDSIINASGLYFSSTTSANVTFLDNIFLSNLQLSGSTGHTIEFNDEGIYNKINLENIDISTANWYGLIIKCNTSYPKINSIIMNNVRVHDGNQVGVYINNVNSLNMNNVVLYGNDFAGAIFNNVNTLEMNNIFANGSSNFGAGNNQDKNLQFFNITHLKANNIISAQSASGSVYNFYTNSSDVSYEYTVNNFLIGTNWDNKNYTTLPSCIEDSYIQGKTLLNTSNGYYSRSTCVGTTWLSTALI